MRLEPGIPVDGKYYLLHELATGRFGPRWLAGAPVDDLEVEIEFLQETLSNRAETMRMVAARLEANDCMYVRDVLGKGTFEFKVFDEQSFIVWERGTDNPLTDILDAPGRVSLEEAVRFARELLEALQSVHDSGLVHGALTPEAIELDPEGMVILGKFGPGSVPGTHFELASTGLLASSPYIPPDEFSSVAADLFGVGAIVYELLAGMPPPPDERRVAGQVMARPGGFDLREVPREIRAFILALTAASPDERPISARAAAVLLPPMDSQRAGRAQEKDFVDDDFLVPVTIEGEFQPSGFSSTPGPFRTGPPLNVFQYIIVGVAGIVALVAGLAWFARLLIPGDG